MNIPWRVSITQDNGCLIVGSTYEGPITHPLIFATQGIFFLKLDSLGNIEWSHGLDKPLELAKLYPNPANEKINVDITAFENEKNMYFTVYDINGKKIFEKNLNESVNTINIHGLKTGVYLYQIKSGKIIFQSGKFVKKD